MKQFFLNLQNYVSTRAVLGMIFFINPAADYTKEEVTKPAIEKTYEMPFEEGDKYFKTPDEVDEFIQSSRAVKAKNLKDYKEVYRPLILSASKIFQIPFSFQSCLIYRESRFNKKALSPVGAMGMAQFTRDTYDFMLKALSIGKSSLEREGLEMLEAVAFPTVDEESGKLTYSKYNVKIFSEMYSLWQEYLITNELEDVRMRKGSYRKFLNTPKYAIGFSSMYLYYLKHRVKYDIDFNVTEKELEDPDFILSVAGAYNQGAGRVLKVVKKAKKRKPNFAKWISHQSKIRETRDYIRSIRGCMRSENRESGKGIAVKGSDAVEKSTIN